VAFAPSAAVNSDINVTFSQNINIAPSFTTMVVNGERRGRYTGTYSGMGSPVMGFNPTVDFAAGELVKVSLTSGLVDAAGNAVTPFVYEFRAATLPSDALFEVPMVVDATVGAGSLGSTAGDFDNDGDIDIVNTVNTVGTIVYLNMGGGVFSEN